MDPDPTDIQARSLVMKRSNQSRHVDKILQYPGIESQDLYTRMPYFEEGKQTEHEHKALSLCWRWDWSGNRMGWRLGVEKDCNQ